MRHIMLSLMVLFLLVGSATATTVFIESESGNYHIEQGDIIVFEIHVSDVDSLFGVSTSLQYDPNLMTVERGSWEAGPMFTDIGEVQGLLEQYGQAGDNEWANFTFAFDRSVDPDYCASGSGIICLVTLRAVGEGRCSVVFRTQGNFSSRLDPCVITPGEPIDVDSWDGVEVIIGDTGTEETSWGKIKINFDENQENDEK